MRDSKIVVVVMALVVGCAPGGAPAAGSDAGTSPGADGGPSSSDGGGVLLDAGSPARFECCINDAPYRCPDQAAFDQCAGGYDPGCFERCMMPECIDACFDAMEMSEPDPSGCFSDPSVTCEVTPSPSCSAGTACDYDDDCSSGNCTNGHCYGNGTGCACDYDDDCSSSNCSESICRDNGVGSACDYDDDCASGNCTNSRCEGNGFGSPCDYDDDCTSGACTGGSCS